MPEPAHAQADRSQRAAGAIGSAWAAAMGVLPHVLHHVGPLAGAALIAGTTGTIVFGALAFLLTIPLLVRVRRRCGSWLVPTGLLVVFVGVWAISTWVVGPWVDDRLADDPPTRQQGRDGDGEHEQHHDTEAELQGVRFPDPTLGLLHLLDRTRGHAEPEAAP